MEFTSEESEFLADAIYSHCHDYDGDLIESRSPSRELLEKLGISFRHIVF
jgi:hypothetical protein